MTLTVKRNDVADEMAQSKMAASSNFAQEIRLETFDQFCM